MSLHGRIPSGFEGRPIQAPGMMRHGPFPGRGLADQRPLESLPLPEILENKVAVQAAEMDMLARENQRLAVSHITLRQELVATQKELHMLQAHVGGVHQESDIQIRGLLEKIGKMEADIRAGELLRKELQQANLEAEALIAARDELSGKIQQVTEELEKLSFVSKNLPEMYAELDGLRQEHQKLRAEFEYEKGSNMQQVEQMQGMEKNLISMAREVEKLRVEVLNAENRTHATNSYGGVYANPPPAYPSVGQVSGYADYSYGQVGSHSEGTSGQISGYSESGFAYGAPTAHSNAYGRHQNPLNSGPISEVTNLYSSVSSAGYSDVYGRPQIPTIAGAATEGTNPYSGMSSVSSNDLARAPAYARRHRRSPDWIDSKLISDGRNISSLISKSTNAYWKLNAKNMFSGVPEQQAA
ncbi:protein FLX-like 4 isoform X2 [Typha latifolia]|uniref:protein FLX-like 4 isoform X2 n=1 Tax=Typha latifolia TaxID=4733 RepID=UPI003C2E5EEC